MISTATTGGAEAEAYIGVACTAVAPARPPPWVRWYCSLAVLFTFKIAKAMYWFDSGAGSLHVKERKRQKKVGNVTAQLISHSSQLYTHTEHLPVVTRLNELSVVLVQNDLDTFCALAFPVNHGTDRRKGQTEMSKNAGKHCQMCRLKGLIDLNER